ncbi:SRPBCC family protein [Nocardia nepalensis]|uniref:SRPBCC family protein n=1 Tax=Nocardia nepalensis TaxID=3375448 RepID=UPI003B66B9EB
MRVHACARVALPRSLVWEVLADHEGMSGWLPGIVAKLERPGQFEANGIGAVRSIGIPGVAVREEIIGHVPRRWLAYKAVSGIPLRSYCGEVLLSGDNHHTTVTWTLGCENRSWVIEFALRRLAHVLVLSLVRAARRQHKRERLKTG